MMIIMEMSELEKMSQGKLYDAGDPSLSKARDKAHSLAFRYNQLDELHKEERAEILKELLPNLGEDSFLTGPIYFDYGFNFNTGARFYANFHFVCLDVCEIDIGDDVYCGPNVSINTPLHPLLAEERNQYMSEHGMTDKEYGKKIVIGSNCWLASNVTICAGAHIGNDCVIGAGSVVVGNIPDGYLAYGVPTKPIRKITKEDSVYLKKDLF